MYGRSCKALQISFGGVFFSLYIPNEERHLGENKIYISQAIYNLISIFSPRLLRVILAEKKNLSHGLIIIARQPRSKI